MITDINGFIIIAIGFFVLSAPFWVLLVKSIFTDDNKFSLCILDFETTGFSAEDNRIIEAGALKVDVTIEDDEVFFGEIETYESFVAYAGTLPEKIIEITGITDKMLIGAPDESQVVAELKNFVGENEIVAYNARFDKAFLRAAAERQGITFNNDFDCAYLAAKKAWPGLSSYSLKSVAEHLAVINENPHRAIGDCMTTLKVHAKSLAEMERRKANPSLAIAD